MEILDLLKNAEYKFLSKITKILSECFGGYLPINNKCKTFSTVF